MQNRKKFYAVIARLLSIFIHLLIISRSVSTDDEEDTTYFPQSIPVYPVRRDVITNEEVSRGRIKDGGGQGQTREDELQGLRQDSAML